MRRRQDQGGMSGVRSKMSETITHTPAAITDMVVDVFSAVNWGDLYYQRIMAAVYMNLPIRIQIEHLQQILPHLSLLGNEMKRKVIGDAIFTFLEKNTAYGFAEWAKANNRLRWHIG